MTKYKRFMVFEYYNYEASGGVNDCYESFDREEDAIVFAGNPNSHDNIEIFDRIEGIEIEWKPKPVKRIDPREEVLNRNREKVFKLMESEK